MNWNDHSKLVGKHAILSPSSYSWINYDVGKPDAYDARTALFNRYCSTYSQAIGTLVHDYARKRILYKMPMKKGDKASLLFYLRDNGIPENVVDMEFLFENILYYVNDAIQYSMSPETMLYYSENCFGCADAISFKKNMLRIHDLKTGRLPAHIEQLEIYAALFCLEYDKKPGDIDMELRIYQPFNMIVFNPDATDIFPIMDQIVSQDRFLTKIRNEGLVM